MRVFVGTERQNIVKGALDTIITWALCPIWIPLVLLLFVLSAIAAIIEHVVLDGSNEIISKISTWFVRKFVK